MQCHHLDHYLFLRRQGKLTQCGIITLEKHLSKCQTCRSWLEEDASFSRALEPVLPEFRQLDQEMLQAAGGLDNQWRELSARAAAGSRFKGIMKEFTVLLCCLAGAFLIMSTTGSAAVNSLLSGFSQALSLGGGTPAGSSAGSMMQLMATFLPNLVLRIGLALLITSFGLLGRSRQGA